MHNQLNNNTSVEISPKEQKIEIPFLTQSLYRASAAPINASDLLCQTHCPGSLGKRILCPPEEVQAAYLLWALAESN